MIEIPNYTVDSELGRGGMATVYLAVQDMLSRNVALKVMLPDMARDENFRKSFLSEGKIIASLEHRNIVRIYDVGIIDDSILYMAMEHLANGTLKRKLDKGKLSYTESLRILEQTSSGLDYAHGKGYIHRDIKPGNILFREDDTAVITDFGIAKLQDTSGELTRMGYTMGTVQYMSPEQAVTTDLDHRSDIYSLGLVFYEMLTGKKAFKADSTIQAIHQHTTVAPPELPADYGFLQSTINKVLAKEPADRFQTVGEFVESVKNAANVDETVVHKVPSNVDNDKTQILQTGHYKVQNKPKSKNGLYAGILGSLIVIGGLAYGVTYIPQVKNLFSSADTDTQVEFIKIKPKEQSEKNSALEKERLLQVEKERVIQAEKERLLQAEKQRELQKEQRRLDDLENERIEQERIARLKDLEKRGELKKLEEQIEKDPIAQLQQQEKAKLEEEKRKEQERIFELERKKEQERLAEIERQEQERLAEIKRQEQLRQAEEKTRKDQERIKELERKAEQVRLAEFEKKEQERLAELKIKEEQKRLAELKIMEEQERIRELERKAQLDRLAKLEKQKEEQLVQQKREFEEEQKRQRQEEQKARDELEKERVRERIAAKEREEQEEKIKLKLQEELNLEKKRERERLAKLEKLEKQKEAKRLAELKNKEKSATRDIRISATLNNKPLKTSFIIKQKGKVVKRIRSRSKTSLSLKPGRYQISASYAGQIKSFNINLRTKDISRNFAFVEKAAPPKPQKVVGGQIRAYATLNGRPLNTTFVVTKNGKRVKSVSGRSSANFTLPPGNYVISTQYGGRSSKANVNLGAFDIAEQRFAFRGSAPAPVNKPKNNWTHSHN